MKIKWSNVITVLCLVAILAWVIAGAVHTHNTLNVYADRIDNLETQVNDLQEHTKAIDDWMTDLSKEYIGTFHVTGYVPGCSHCCGNTAGIAANGEKAVAGETCAADWSVLPEGTTVLIEGLGVYRVNDKGGAIKGNKIDVACATHSECYQVTGDYEVYGQ